MVTDQACLTAKGPEERDPVRRLPLAGRELQSPVSFRMNMFCCSS